MTFIKHFRSVFTPWQYPTISGAIIGMPYGIYYGYNDSRKYSFEANVIGTIVGGVCGFFQGGILGFFWPISIPVGILRNYNLEFKK